MEFGACSLFGRFAVCFAGDVTTGSRCEARNEHSDIRLDSHIERLASSPHREVRSGTPGLSRHCAECRGCSESRKRAGFEYAAVLGGVWQHNPFADRQRLQSPRRKPRADTHPLHECSSDSGLETNGQKSQRNRIAGSSATHGAPHVRCSFQRIDFRFRKYPYRAERRLLFSTDHD